MGQRALPGFRPGYVRLELDRTEDGTWRLATVASDSRGFVVRADGETYDGLTYEEAVDVIEATLDTFRESA